MRSRESDRQSAEGPDEGDLVTSFAPGSNVAVEGRWRDVWGFCRANLSRAETGVALVAPEGIATTTDGFDPAALETPLVTVGGAGASVAGRAVDVAVADRTLADLGEQTFAVLDGERTPPCDLLCLTGVATLLEWGSVQGVYRLLYVLANRVSRTGGLAFYAIDDAIDAKTKRILRQPLDFEVTFDDGREPAVRSLTGRSAPT